MANVNGLLAKGVPPQPLWLLYIKGGILFLSLIIFCLSCFTLSRWGGGPGGLTLWAALLSFIVYGGAAALEIKFPQYFYRIGALVGYILTVIFWLSGWAWSADAASAWLRVASHYVAWGSFYKDHKAVGGSFAACAALGAVTWVLTIVHLVYFILASIRDDSVQNQEELGQVKTEAPAQQQFQQQPVYAQQQFQQQPVYAQQPQQAYQQPYGQQ